jgi:hypothetical protein
MLTTLHGFVASAIAIRKDIQITANFRGVPISSIPTSELRKDFLTTASGKSAGQQFFSSLWTPGLDVRNLLVHEGEHGTEGEAITDLSKVSAMQVQAAKRKGPRPSATVVLTGDPKKIAATVRHLPQQEAKKHQQIPLEVRNRRDLLLGDD